MLFITYSDLFLLISGSGTSFAQILYSDRDHKICCDFAVMQPSEVSTGYHGEIRGGSRCASFSLWPRLRGIKDCCNDVQSSFSRSTYGRPLHPELGGVGPLGP
jgi:hypothetical protein